MDNLKKHKIRHVVISPGGTNIGFIKAIQDDDFFKCYSVVDERSAVYFAIGLYLQTGEIIAALCTSAQATRNYIPGLTEAYYKNAPIFAITMSKHPRFTYQGYMQAPDQCSLPKDCVKKSFMLPVISEPDDVLESIRKSNEAMLELNHHGKGPVQLCIPWLDFPLTQKLIKNRDIKRFSYQDEFSLDIKDKRVLIVIGEHLPFSPKEIESIEKFCDSYNSAIYVNHLSNYYGKYALSANLLFSTIDKDYFIEYLQPDILITIGGQTGDYPLYKILSKIEIENMEHWRVSPDGKILDTYDKLTKVFELSEEYFFTLARGKELANHEYYESFKACLPEIKELEFPLSNVFVAHSLVNMIPSNSIVQFSILNSLRVWNLFKFKNKVSCFSNVAAFGIDGGLSTLIGQSLATESLCFMIIGDLAFLYDLNCLSIRDIRRNVRILLLNNNGGIEFKLGNVDRISYNRYISASNHFKNGKGWAETCGFKYISASSIEEFEKNKLEFVSEGESSILFELFISDINEAYAYRKLIETYSPKTFKKRMKNVLKKLSHYS